MPKNHKQIPVPINKEQELKNTADLAGGNENLNNLYENSCRKRVLLKRSVGRVLKKNGLSYSPKTYGILPRPPQLVILRYQSRKNLHRFFLFDTLYPQKLNIYILIYVCFPAHKNRNQRL